MWRSRLDGKDVIEDVYYLAKKLHDYAPNNQIVITYNNSMCKILRKDYYPDKEGKVVFLRDDKWREESYCVAEMLEFIEKYGELITDLKFQASDYSLQPLVNFSETCDFSGIVWYTHIIVGDGSLPLTQVMPKKSQQSMHNPNVKIVI